jgi:hypothetical protein
MTRLSEAELEKAIAHVRDPYGLDEGRKTMDMFELGALRLLSWLRQQGYQITAKN